MVYIHVTTLNTVKYLVTSYIVENVKLYNSILYIHLYNIFFMFSCEAKFLIYNIVFK